MPLRPFRAAPRDADNSLLLDQHVARLKTSETHGALENKILENPASLKPSENAFRANLERISPPVINNSCRPVSLESRGLLRT